MRSGVTLDTVFTIQTVTLNTEARLLRASQLWESIQNRRKRVHTVTQISLDRFSMRNHVANRPRLIPVTVYDMYDVVAIYTAVVLGEHNIQLITH